MFDDRKFNNINRVKTSIVLQKEFNKNI